MDGKEIFRYTAAPKNYTFDNVGIHWTLDKETAIKMGKSGDLIAPEPDEVALIYTGVLDLSNVYWAETLVNRLTDVLVHGDGKETYYENEVALLPNRQILVKSVDVFSDDWTPIKTVDVNKRILVKDTV